ncbi:hypothetical protein PHLGIDRAFT_24802 [Phlebiopsis gigantea 11061_1 CR5-6]|uniref:NYN domain-containing protein n=1 Tax=Phlebiopsis gigantea (strain 11061_1 CR5-6) TaxID=745531 RepID=A0A0C3NLT8_PHLG1|nr:hypothetical protein PHLGIDRAFT_24802 [Phlebiopsis gigantea 11061_1 CR5-6]
MSSEPESVAIFWDYENCEIPGVADSYLVTNGIRRIAHEYGNVKVFKAYSESYEVVSPRTTVLRSDLQACGVTMVDCPHNGRKDVADKMIMVDILAHAIDCPPPSTVLLISGDRDFSYAVSTMRLRGYRVVLLAPGAAHSSLRSQASVVYEWPRSVLQADMPAPTPPPKSRTPAAYATRPSAPIPIERATPSMIHIGSSPHSTLFQPNNTANPGDNASSSLLEHSRSSSCPNPGFALPTINPSGVYGKPNNVPMASHSRSQSLSPLVPTHRLSPGWRSSRLAATAPPFQPYSASTVRATMPPYGMTDTNGDQPPLPVVMDQESDPRSTLDGDLSGDATDRRPVPSTPAGTEVSLDDEGGTPATFDMELTHDAHDRRSATSSTPITPLDDAIGFAPGTKPAEEGEEEDELRWVQVHPDVVVPTVAMTRLRKPPQKFKLLVRVLERERLTGNTRVNFSQLGALLRQEHPAVYQRAGCAQLKDYVALAEDEGVVIIGKHIGEPHWDNGNKWAALHPQYHGKIPEPQPAQQPYPPPPPMQPSFANI